MKIEILFAILLVSLIVVSGCISQESYPTNFNKSIESIVCEVDSDCVVRVNNYEKVMACNKIDVECTKWEKTI